MMHFKTSLSAMAVTAFALCSACADTPDRGKTMDWFGMAMMRSDRTVVLQLRSRGPGGEVAETLLEYPPSHPDYRKILEHTGRLEVGVWKSVPPWPSE
jgi:hypothetical protein